MFELIVGTVSAMNQVAAFIAALACGGLGGLLVGSAIYWRLHAIRVQGEVIGVRQSGNCFDAVYRYTAPSGETLEGTSTEGSSSTRGKETGTQVPLLVIPGKPQEVQEARSHVFTIVGALLLAAAAGIFYIAVRSWRPGPMTWVVAALFVFHLLNGLRKIWAPQDKSLRAFSLRELVARRQGAASGASPVTRIEDLVSDPAYQARQGAQRATLRRVAPFLLLAGLGLLAAGVYQSRSLMRLESSGIRTAGLVTGFRTSHDHDGVTYHPVVAYTDGAGHAVEFTDSVGSNPPLYRRGDAVTVLYRPEKSGSAIVDRGPWNWLPALLLYLFGAGLAAVGVSVLRAPRPEPTQTAAIGPAA